MAVPGVAVRNMSKNTARQLAAALLLSLYAAGAVAQFRSGGPPSASVSSDPPNVLILLADDFMHATLGVVDPYIQTPNLDRLAAQGVRITRQTIPSVRPAARH